MFTLKCSACQFKLSHVLHTYDVQHTKGITRWHTSRVTDGSVLVVTKRATRVIARCRIAGGSRAKRSSIMGLQRVMPLVRHGCIFDILFRVSELQGLRLDSHKP